MKTKKKKGYLSKFLAEFEKIPDRLYKMASVVMFILIFSSVVHGQTPKSISNEAEVLAYTLPELLIANNGKQIQSAKEWEKIRRPEILALIEREEYGKVPGKLKISKAKVLETDDLALNGKAIRKQVLITFQKNGKDLNVELLMYLPKGKKEFPTFLGYNFNGNQTVNSDPGIHISKEWNGPAKERGSAAENWPVEMIINAGCGVATMYYWDIAPDKNDLTYGIYTLFYKPEQNKPAADEWGALSAWAWGLSRALDYMKTDKQVDGNKVVILGHSRLGKASIWAGAADQRFAAVISNNSGCCGAALSKRIFGETVGNINQRFPHWCCENFKKYSNNEGSLSFDQHMLLALIAPRPLYVASASEDLWADPKGEYLSACYASKVYTLYGFQTGLDAAKLPEMESPISGIISHHIRKGKHNILAYDWKLYIDFANQLMK